MTTKRLPVSHDVPLLSSDLPAGTLSFFLFFSSFFSVGIFSTVLWHHALPQESLLLYLTWRNTFLIALIYAATFPLAPRSLPHSQFTLLLLLQYSTTLRWPSAFVGSKNHFFYSIGLKVLSEPSTSLKAHSLKI